MRHVFYNSASTWYRITNGYMKYFVSQMCDKRNKKKLEGWGFKSNS